MKSIACRITAPRPHWVGNYFPARTLFSYRGMAPHIGPFLLLDHAGPAEFPPSDKLRGVGPYPHRGFEMVTIIYGGEVAYRDSTGSTGLIGPGDAHRITAGSGSLDEEFYSDAFMRSGGALEIVHLRVNLPKRTR